MFFKTKKNFNLYLILFFLIFLTLLIYLSIYKFQKNKKSEDLAMQAISINLITSVHPKLSWVFTAKKNKIDFKPGEIKVIEYMVENLGDENTTGIATFAYFPSQFGNYINKINCFCYDAKTLKAGEKSKFTLVLMIDPKVTKDSKTKNIKNVTIQFTFFDYEEYKKG